jgi:hypothetical protein
VASVEAIHDEVGVGAKKIPWPGSITACWASRMTRLRGGAARGLDAIATWIDAVMCRSRNDPTSA